MKSILVLLLILFNVNSIVCQSVMLTAEETARMFHIVKKSKTLNRNLAQYFNYTGDTIYFEYFLKGERDSIIDYDAIVKKIALEPSLLKIDFYGLKTESPGLLAELASKMALFQLYVELKKRNEEPENGISDKAYQYFIDTLTIQLPNGVVRKKNGKNQPSSQIIDLIDPNLFFNQRSTALAAFQSITQPQQKTVIEAINYATRSYLQIKGREYFSKICHLSPEFTTNLLACGDGSNTDGLLEEREKIYKHKNELGDPIGVGLFTYETTFEAGNKNKQTLVPLQSATLNFNAIENAYTTLHLSLWGFNRNQQTTVAVYREDKMYLLYANKITKELSPDTTFGQGQTLQSITKHLEDKIIPELDEQINGKNGIRAKLESKDTSHKDVLMEIILTEEKLVLYRYEGLKNKKKTKKGQDHLAWLYSKKLAIEKRQKELTAELHDSEARMARLRERLMELKSYVNKNEMKYSNFGYVYTFEDGVTFNANTQNLTFPDSLKTEKFEVRLITFGPDAMSKFVDEIQLLTSVIKGGPEDWSTHDYNLTLLDVFKSDSYLIEDFTLEEEQQFEVSKLLNKMLIHKGTLNFNLEGNGVGVLMDGKVVGSIGLEEDAYPGETKEAQNLSRESENYKPLRTSYLQFTQSENTLNLSIQSFTDPVKSNFAYKVSGVKEIKNQFDSITDNRLLSAFRTFYLAEQFVKELAIATHLNFKGKDVTKLDQMLKNTLQKSKVKMGDLYLRYEDYAKVAHPESEFYQLVLQQIADKEAERKELLGYENKGKKKK